MASIEIRDEAGSSIVELGSDPVPLGFDARGRAARGRGRVVRLVAEVEKKHFARVVETTGWNKAWSARMLAISKPTLYDKIRAYGLAPE